MTDARAPATREEIRQRLRALAESPPPTDLSPGAMCYSPIGPPDRVEHVCVDCGERTLYPRTTPPRAWLALGRGFSPQSILEIVSHDLDVMRRLIDQIEGLDVRLDEGRLCQRCSPGAAPVVELVIRYPDQRREHRVLPVDLDDVRLLSELAAGKTKHEGDYGCEKPLQEHLARLEELLGVKQSR